MLQKDETDKKEKTKEVIQMTLVLKFSDHELAQHRDFGLRFSQKDIV